MSNRATTPAAHAACLASSARRAAGESAREPTKATPLARGKRRADRAARAAQGARGQTSTRSKPLRGATSTPARISHRSSPSKESSGEKCGLGSTTVGEAKQHSSAPATRRLAAGATLIAFATFAIAAAGCAKKAPSFEDVPPADELYKRGMKTLEGRRLFRLFHFVNHQKAIDTFQAIIDNYPYSEYAVKAELRIADAYFEDKRYEEALSYYRDFGDMHPQHPQVPYTILRSALCHYKQITSVSRDQTSSREALHYLSRLLKNYPYSPEASQGETIVYELRSRLSRNVLQIGDFYLKRREFQAAAERYRTVLNGYPGLGLDAEALYKLGVCYENMRREDEALRLFHVVIENFHGTEAARQAADHIAAAN